MSLNRGKLFGALAAVLFVMSTGATSQQLAPQSSQEGGVTVRVTPLDISADAKSWSFEVVLDTHSQDLADDLTQTAAVIDEAGRSHAPLAWEGAPPGGHHRKGVLRFAPITPPPAALELRVQRPGEPKPRTFRWPLK
jgi:hypothetical protein